MSRLATVAECLAVQAAERLHREVTTRDIRHYQAVVDDAAISAAMNGAVDDEGIELRGYEA